MSPAESYRLRADASAIARARMVREQLVSRGIDDDATLTSMGAVPREEFVASAARQHAYADRALSIGRGQTISQPYIVARMTSALDLGELGWPWRSDAPTLLDVGTGSGYQAAVLSQSGASVTSIERDPAIAAEARARLRQLGFDTHVVVGDGSDGYPPHGPYAGIVVAAAAPSVPDELVEQLTDGGRLVIPVGSRDSQRLTVVHRRGRQTEIATSDACVFVPLVGRSGFPD